MMNGTQLADSGFRLAAEPLGTPVSVPLPPGRMMGGRAAGKAMITLLERMRLCKRPRIVRAVCIAERTAGD